MRTTVRIWDHESRAGEVTGYTYTDQPTVTYSAVVKQSGKGRYIDTTRAGRVYLKEEN
jgi:hypothetical protein